MITRRKIKKIGIKMRKSRKIRNKKVERNKIWMILIMIKKKILKTIRKTKKVKKI
jgi:hypothetical protein